MNHEPEWITLDREQIKFADGVARRRQDRAERGNIPGGNNAPEDHDTAISYNFLGARCEHAAERYFKPVYWNLTDLKAADLDIFIDVKGRSETWHDLMVPVKLHEDWAYLLVNGENHPHYEIVAWCWGIEALDIPITDPARRNSPAHFVSREHDIMKDPRDLRRELGRRQAARAIRAGVQFEFISGVWP